MTGLKLADIEVFTKEYATARQAVVDTAETMRREMEDVKRNHITTLKQHVALAAEKKQQLSNAIDSNKTLFDKPRTFVFNGVKVGYQKQKGKITWDDKEKVVELIKKHFSEQTDTMLSVETTPVKGALEQLSATELKSIACTLSGAGDAMVIKPVDANVDELVEDLLRDENKD